jgi:hypothetical protein
LYLTVRSSRSASPQHKKEAREKKREEENTMSAFQHWLCTTLHLSALSGGVSAFLLSGPFGLVPAYLPAQRSTHLSGSAPLRR